jgi:ring-1,2-phenylacetyl-CoA epoxidase subunit PaaC
MENKNQGLFEYCLWLGDNNLILGHRLSEWCGHGPILEEDIALINIALDLIGQSRTVLTYAGELENKGRSEDDLAYLRDCREFKNAMLLEQPNGDFAKTILRQFFFDAFHYHLYTQLIESKDKKLASIAEKSLKEITYHVRHSSEWVKRLGDGTTESHQRMQDAVEALWMYTDDLFVAADSEEELIKAGIVPELGEVKAAWIKQVSDVMKEATLLLPENTFMQKGSKTGKHTEHLGFLLAEMQFLQRAYPGASW